MVAIDSVEGRFEGIWRNSACCAEWRLTMVWLSKALAVQLLKIYCSSWLAIFLSHHDHAGAPFTRYTNWNLFYDTRRHISIQASFNFGFPMVGNKSRCITCIWDSIGLQVDSVGKGLDLLKVLEKKASRRCCWSLGMLSGVGG